MNTLAPQTASLEFAEFSYINDQGIIQRTDTDNVKALAQYLWEAYKVIDVIERLPYLILVCEDKVPEPSERPFLVAGLVGIWLIDGGNPAPDDTDLGERGCADTLLQLQEEILSDLKFFVIPKAETLSKIMAWHYPDAIAISYVNDRIIVEFPETPWEDFVKKLSSLPGDIADNEVQLRFCNGPIHTQELAGVKEQEPQTLNGEFDDTDYVRNSGGFTPGVMLSSKSNKSTTAGVLVEKEGIQRLTVAIHCWQEELDDPSIKFGQEDCFSIMQGDWETGTLVGNVTEQIGQSDIGLATLTKPFSNRMFDLGGSVTTLLHSREIKHQDRCWIDSFTTGPQQLACNGLRVRGAKERGESLYGKKEDLPGPGKYIELVQGIYATSVPEINTRPQIREGVCGSAVFRAQRPVGNVASSSNPPNKDRSIETSPMMGISQETPGESETKIPSQEVLAGTTPTKGRQGSPASVLTPITRREVLERTTGEVIAFMHWSDVQSVFKPGKLLCYADSVDDMIEEGWQIVATTKKRTLATAGLDEEDLFTVKT